jgi:ribosomal protein S6
MQKYELLLVLPGTFDEKEVENEANRVLSVVSEIAQNASANKLGKNRLAYPIKQIRYGYFYTVVFETETEKIKDLKNKLDLDKNILRSVITRYNEKMANAQKIAYFAVEGKEDSEGEAVEERRIVEPVKKEEVREEKREEVSEEKPMDLKDIDKKLDEILADDNLMTKV